MSDTNCTKINKQEDIDELKKLLKKLEDKEKKLLK